MCLSTDLCAQFNIFYFEMLLPEKFSELELQVWKDSRNMQMESPRLMNKLIPEEIFTGENPEVSHLNIFGFSIYIHIPKEKRSKLDPSGKKGFFVGYSE